MKTNFTIIMTILGYTVIAIGTLFLIGYFLYQMKEIVVGLKHINFNLYAIAKELSQGYKLVL